YGRSDYRENSVLARFRELGLTSAEARGVAAAILIAGTETVTNAVPRTVALLVDSGQQSALRAEPELVQSAIDEALRMVVPTPVMLRSVVTDVVVEAVSFEAGQRVVLLTYNLLKSQGSYR